MAGDERDDVRRALGQASIFAELDSPEVDTLAAMAVRKKYRARDIVLRKGDPAMQIYVILRGRLKTITSGGEGRQAAFSIMGPGEVFGEVAVLDGEPRSATITALEPCELIILQRNDFFHFLERSPKAAIKLLQVLARRLRRLSERVEDTTFLEVPGRLAKQLVRLAERYGQKHGSNVRIELKLSQQELGDLVGATRESVNKQLRAWVTDGIVEQSTGKLVILDLDALARSWRRMSKSGWLLLFLLACTTTPWEPAPGTPLAPPANPAAGELDDAFFSDEDPAPSEAVDPTIAELRKQAVSVAPLVQSPWVKEFVAAAAELPPAKARTLRYDDPEKGLVEKPVDTKIFYETKYGSPLAYARALDLTAAAGMPSPKGASVVDFGYGTMGHLRLLASLARASSASTSTRFFAPSTPMRRAPTATAPSRCFTGTSRRRPRSRRRRARGTSCSCRRTCSSAATSTPNRKCPPSSASISGSPTSSSWPPWRLR